MLHAEMKYSLGILVVGLHHIVYIILHGIGAGTLMEHYIHINTIKFLILNGSKEVILVHIIDELQATKIPIRLTLFLAVI